MEPNVPDPVQDGLHGANIIHLHPTLRCNLSCRHCYSSSAPHFRDALAPRAVIQFLEVAREQGYDVLSVSGGEPLMYKGLEEVFAEAKRMGYQNNLATNAMLVRAESSRRALALADVIAVSIDGRPDMHDQIRGLNGSFAKTLEGIQDIRDMGKAFGIIHTLTRHSWEDLFWLGDFAATLGAALLQLHPLEGYGRASTGMEDDLLDHTASHSAFIITELLRDKYHGRMFIQLDLLHRAMIEAAPEIVSVFPGKAIHRLSDLQNVLIVTESGDVVPTVYGFPEHFHVGSIHQGPAQLRAAFDRFHAERLHALRDLYHATYQAILDDPALELVNWNSLVLEMSHRTTKEAVRA